MKKLFLYLLLFTTIFNTYSQSCIPNTSTITAGFYPNNLDIDCAVNGIAYDQTISYKSFSGAVYDVQIDSITNIPNGLYVSYYSPILPAGDEGCARIIGIPNDLCGQYKINIYISIPGVLNGELSDLATQNPNFFGGGDQENRIIRLSEDTCANLISPQFNDFLQDTCNIISQPTDQSILSGSSAIFSVLDSISGATYQWQMNSGTGFLDLNDVGQFSGSTTNTLTVSSISGSNNNTQFRCIVDACCRDTTNIATLYHLTSVIELNNSLIKLFPNPSNGNITITIAQHSNCQMILTDILGKELFSKSFNSNEVQLNLKSLESKGTYFVKVLDSDGNIIAIEKLIYQ